MKNTGHCAYFKCEKPVQDWKEYCDEHERLRNFIVSVISEQFRNI